MEKQSYSSTWKGRRPIEEELDYSFRKVSVKAKDATNSNVPSTSSVGKKLDWCCWGLVDVAGARGDWTTETGLMDSL